jgi:sulfonate transport system permease protein
MAADGSLALDASPPTDRLRRPARVAGAYPALAGLLLPVVLGVLWEALVYFGLANGRLVPPPSAIFSTLYELALTGELYVHVKATLLRVLAGFVAGTIAGTLVGALIGYFQGARQILDPSLQGLRAVPSIAWVPLFILWFGIFEASKVTLIAVGVFFPIYLGVLGAIQSVDRKIVEVGRAFRLSSLGLVRRILPMSWRCAAASGSAGCSSSRRSSWGPPRGWATCSSTASSSASRSRSSPPS